MSFDESIEGFAKSHAAEEFGHQLPSHLALFIIAELLNNARSPGCPVTDDSWPPHLATRDRAGLFEHIILTPTGRQHILLLREDGAQLFLTLLQEVLDLDALAPRHPAGLGATEFRKVAIKVMIKLARISGRFPSTLWLFNIHLEPRLLGEGASGVVHVGQWVDRAKHVAVKCFRHFSRQSNAKMEKQLYQEALLWRQLSNKHILPFYGICQVDQRPALVSEYQSNENLSEYIRKYPNANKQDLLIQTARGLFYLHDNGVVHRDLKGQNVLIGDDGRAMLADFGFSRVQHDLSDFAPSSSEAGTIAYMSPELLLHGPSVASKSSDIWALGMVIYEVLAERIPYQELRFPGAVVLAIAKGILPLAPAQLGVHSDLTDAVWKFLERSCWKQKAKDRSCIEICIQGLSQTAFFKRGATGTASSSTMIEVHASRNFDPLDVFPDMSGNMRPWHPKFPETSPLPHDSFPPLLLGQSPIPTPHSTHRGNPDTFIGVSHPAPAFHSLPAVHKTVSPELLSPGTFAYRDSAQLPRDFPFIAHDLPSPPTRRTSAQRMRGLPKQATDVLKEWFNSHAYHAYPSEEEKRDLCARTQLSDNQVSNWMCNARLRLNNILTREFAAAQNVPNLPRREVRLYSR